MPRRMRTATLPITAPAMRPGEGPDFVEEEDAAAEEVDSARSERVLVASLDVRDRDGVGVVPVLWPVDTGVDSTDCRVLCCGADVVRVGDGATLVAGVSDANVGSTMVMLALDRNEVISPPMLERMLLICLRCAWYRRCTIAAPMLPAARQ